MSILSRRNFVQGSVAASGLLWMRCKATGGKSKMEDSGLNGAGTGPLRVRKSLTNLVDGKVTLNPAVDKDLQSYKKAVEEMSKAQVKGADGKDISVWESQALIHQKFCPHGNWYFLPWHRWYLYYFEQLCAKYSGDATFALPYWNWFQYRQIPTPLCEEQVNNVKNALWHRGRSAVPTSVLPIYISSADNEKKILDSKDFEAFGSGRVKGIRDRASQGILESTIHNGVHVFIGGDMGSFMSPQDPIFWLHHCSVDRLWAQWASQRGPELCMPDAPESGELTPEFWRAQEVGDFVDMDGHTVKGKIGNCINFRYLGFSYDVIELEAGIQSKPSTTDQNTAPASASLSLTGSKPRKRLTLAAQDIDANVSGSTLVVTAPSKFKNMGKMESFRSLLTGFSAVNADKLFTLDILGLAIPADSNVYYLVYLYLGQQGGSSRSVDNSVFVGAVSFFGGHNHAGEAAQTTANYSFDVTTQIAAEVKKLGGSFSAASLFVVVTAKQGDQDVRMPNGHEIELRIKVSSTNS